MSIIQDDYIDEEEARNFLHNLYNGIDLLPGVLEKITLQEAAAILNVSVPTLNRLIAEDKLKLNKQNIIDLIMKNMLAEKPIEDDQIINLQGQQTSLISQKSTINIENNSKNFHKENVEEAQLMLFSIEK